jgi:membrane protein YdbS with pleckstrin-like domain
MPEETVWRGTPSQLKNVGAFLLWLIVAIAIIAASAAVSRGADPGVAAAGKYILVLLIFPIFMAGACYLKTKTKIYELTTERLKITEGVFSRVTDTLELYRVKDMETRQPFSYRLGGLENVQINTSDASSPFIMVEAVPSRVAFADKLRNQVEAIRAQKGVREIDVE